MTAEELKRGVAAASAEPVPDAEEVRRVIAERRELLGARSALLRGSRGPGDGNAPLTLRRWALAPAQ